jgi:diguanylate cyclase (GGDEF)-like protein/PAS domain S-box-containing protein
MPNTNSFQTSKKTVFAATALCGIMGLSSLYWSIRSSQPAYVVVFFFCTVALVPFIYHIHKRYLDKHMSDQEDAAVYKELLNQVNDAILVLSIAEPYRIIEANQTACDRLGYSREELLRLSAADLTDLGATENLLRKSPGTEDSGTAYGEIHYKTKNQVLVPAETHVRVIRLRGQRALLSVSRDLSERRKMEDKIRHMAYYDDLTGLPNRRLFRERLGRAMELTRSGGEGLAVFYLDIDRFKLVNDSFGHDYGDMLLMQVAERFTRLVGDQDFLARTEGDEFAIFHTSVGNKERLEELAGRVGEVLEQPFSIGEVQIHISASIGISYYTGEDEVADTLMKQADIALSRSKEKGKNNYQIFNLEMNAVSLKRLTLESELRRAIIREEFMLVYQPQLDTESGMIVGMEALIRWNHPERGIISPQDFIPVAEDSGLIVPIGEWVISEACKQNKAWQDAGYTPVPISVNLSIRQFLQHNLKGRIQAILEQTGLPARYLELEITESMTMDVDFASSLLRELKELGVKISIDDFGTGYSSLYLLKRFPIDKLKIDRSFVRDIMSDPNDAAIVATIISMTRHLNLKVIAEGVETEEQLDFLYRNHCHEVQGFWFSPPVTAGKIMDYLHIHKGKLPGGGIPEEGGMTRKIVS